MVIVTTINMAKVPYGPCWPALLHKSVSQLSLAIRTGSLPIISKSVSDIHILSTFVKAFPNKKMKRYYSYSNL